MNVYYVCFICPISRDGRTDGRKTIWHARLAPLEEEEKENLKLCFDGGGGGKRPQPSVKQLQSERGREKGATRQLGNKMDDDDDDHGAIVVEQATNITACQVARFFFA